MATRKEKTDLLPVTRARPADAFIPKGTNGMNMALNVTVVSPLLAYMVYLSANEPAS